MKENELRDRLFEKHKDNLSSLFEASKTVAQIDNSKFPHISALLKRRTEAKINKMLENLGSLHLDGKEVRLVRDADSTTRIDLLGHIADSGDLTIIELKKSDQTERQAFTELLAYANHFCTLFPPLSESSLHSILVAPMEGRGVRDAFAQEITINDKNIVALIPHIDGETISLQPFYPSDLYYRWIENNILDDSSITVVTASFPLIEGWIDAGAPGGSPPAYTQQAFKTMTGLISQRLEAEGLHGFVYARQYWHEVCPAFPNPNTIVLCLVNPFSPHRTSSDEGVVFGDSDENRLNAVQAIIDQIEDSEFWLDSLHSAFMGQAIRIIQESFDEFFMSTNGIAVRPDIGLPDWGSFKTSMVEAVVCHNMQIKLSGLLRTIFTEYMTYCYANGIDDIYFSDDLPKFGYIAHDHFLAVWEILRGLSLADSDE
ncbi:hypothetical protein HUO14_02535 [Parasphingorhabdus flavimaris]|uniref:DUF91 domain-containing protein n=1 Tax=Parasphingorhabdus flavimaris TaxID=266812 RepID=A0ABX2MZJ4_9SPHN|nr:hypothetical protein [Parasphingorhabdus flavimaris]NVD26781.1 hypothetical protein [Parasphingorhabdus flavimaris]